MKIMENSGELTYFDLNYYYKLGLRRKKFQTLNKLEKSFYISCLFLSKKIKKIKNFEVIFYLKKIIRKIKNNLKNKIIEEGEKMAENIRSSKVCEIMPKIKEMLNETTYVFWLGLKKVFLSSRIKI